MKSFVVVDEGLSGDDPSPAGLVAAAQRPITPRPLVSESRARDRGISYA